MSQGLPTSCVTKKLPDKITYYLTLSGHFRLSSFGTYKKGTSDSGQEWNYLPRTITTPFTFTNYKKS